MQNLNEEFDSMLIKILEKVITIENFYDTIFGFLFRKTDFFSNLNSKIILENQYDKYLSKYRELKYKEDIFKLPEILKKPQIKAQIYTPQVLGNYQQNKNISKEKRIPKRPMSPYFLFCAEKRNEIKRKITFQEMNKMWNELDQEKKEEYKKLYEEKMKIYEKEMDDYRKDENNDTSIGDGGELGNENKKIKANGFKIEQIKNNQRACNCGVCFECKNYKKKDNNDE